MDGLDGRLTRKAHPWVDSRPSEDQAAYAARGRSDEGLALWLPSLSDPLSVAHALHFGEDVTSAAPNSRVMRSRLTWPAWRSGVLILVLSAATAFPATAGASSGPTVRPVVLPRDQGAHPGFGEEWWYTYGT